MKTGKKVLAILITVAMLFTIGFTALAAETVSDINGNNGTITIDNAVAGETYKVYQLFKLESYSYTAGSEEAGAYSYTITSDSEWYDFVNPDGGEDGKDYVSLTLLGTKDGVSTYYVAWNSEDDGDVADFAKAALAYASDNGIVAAAEAKASDGQEETANVAVSKNEDGEAYTIVFSGLNLGYYLADTSLGTLCSLDTTNNTVTIKEKNMVPTVVKTADEKTVNDANIGDTVSFSTAITAYSGADNYVLHDIMSDGLTLNADSFTLKVGDEDVSADSYEIVTDCDDGCTFEIVFKQAYLDTITEQTEIVVSYDATLNEIAQVGGTGNTNETKLTYGDDPATYSSTTSSKTTTYTWELNIFKYTNYGSDNQPLAGAAFKLSTDQAGADVINLVEKTDEDGETYYQVCTLSECEHEHVTEIITEDSGELKIEGLKSNTYYLTEVTAPNGYNKLAGPVKVVVSSKSGDEQDEDSDLRVETLNYYNYNAVKADYDAEGTSSEEYKVLVLNLAGAELPSTGGMGTTIFYVVGLILVIGTAVLLITKKRMGADR